MASQSQSQSQISSDLPLSGRVAIITGSSRGIGRSIALHLHSLGAKIVLNSSTPSPQTTELASSLGSTTAISVPANISDPDQVKHLFDTAEEAFHSPIHIVVNSAGIIDPKYSTLSDTSVETWDSLFAVNTRGAFLVARESARRIARGGGGRIVMLSTSVVGSVPEGYGGYAASKAAVEAMTKVLAKELKGSGITANCVAPGPVASELFFAGKTDEMVKRFVESSPMGRLGEGRDIAEVVGFLVGDGGGWVNGQVIRVNGGLVI